MFRMAVQTVTESESFAPTTEKGSVLRHTQELTHSSPQESPSSSIASCGDDTLVRAMTVQVERHEIEGWQLDFNEQQAGPVGLGSQKSTPGFLSPFRH